MRMRTKWRIKFAVATKKLNHNIESEIKGSVDEQRREMNDYTTGAAQILNLYYAWD